MKLIFERLGDGKCKLKRVEEYADEESLTIPDYSADGDAVTSIEREAFHECKFRTVNLPQFYDLGDMWDAWGFKDRHIVEELNVSANSETLSSFDGILYTKNKRKLLFCPGGKKGNITIPDGTEIIGEDAFYGWNCLGRIVLPEGLKCVERSAFGDCDAKVYFPRSVDRIDENAFVSEWGMCATICAPRDSYALRFAIANDLSYEISDYLNTWDASSWLAEFQSSKDFHSLRQKVWQNTLAIVADGGYNTVSGCGVSLYDRSKKYGFTRFYRASFSPIANPQQKPVEITVVPDDCLDAAHKWVSQGLVVCVLNMASRRNPGGGVRNGAGAQEEYLFRCSDYYRSLYRYADYAPLYKIEPAPERYPLDRDYGGIYSENITIFRENEKNGYALLEEPWTVNMIAVAGMNSPKLVSVNGEARIVSHLTDGVKNKIRTIFRIAIDNGQTNLVLGALGCGAFHNPPKHVAELFRDVLCEQEFQNAFERICFAVKTDHNSHGGKNYDAFYAVLNGFVPTVQTTVQTTVSANGLNHIKQVAVGRDYYAVLDDNGEVALVNIRNSSKTRLHNFHDIKQIAMGFDHLLGLRQDGRVVVEGECQQAQHAKSLPRIWYGGVELYACEAHSAMLCHDGTLRCADDYGFECPPEYGSIAEKWSNIKQAALTFDEPYALTRDGKFICSGQHGGEEMLKYFNVGKSIKQIAAFQCYYDVTSVAVLYCDNTVRAFGNGHKWEDVVMWKSIKKVCCGSGFVAGLTEDGHILMAEPNPCSDLFDIVDIAVNFNHLIAVTRDGNIIYRHI